MNKSDYIESMVNDLRRTAKNEMFINISQLAKSMGVSHERAREMVFGMFYTNNGREKLYYIPDVADTIYQKRENDKIGVKRD